MEEENPDVSWWTWIKYVYEAFWGPNTEHELPRNNKKNGKDYVLVGVVLFVVGLKHCSSSTNSLLDVVVYDSISTSTQELAAQPP